MACEMKMICDWIVWYFRTCMFVQLHNYVWGRMLRRGCTGREQNNITFCIRKSWQSLYQHVINKTTGSDNIDKCCYVLYIALWIRRRTQDQECQMYGKHAHGKSLKHLRIVGMYSEIYMLKKSTERGWLRTEWLGELDNPASVFTYSYSHTLQHPVKI
jgi:hypothetical protein